MAQEEKLFPQDLQEDEMDEWTRTLTTGSKPQSLPCTSGTTGAHECIKESNSKRRQEDKGRLKLTGMVPSMSSRMDLKPHRK